MSKKWKKFTESLVPLTSEAELLLLLSSVSLNKNLAGLLTSMFDWDKIWKVAEQQRIASLAYQHLKDLPGVPTKVLDKFRYYYLSHSARILKFQAEFWKIDSLFRSQNIAIMPLKGIILGYLAYKNPSLRPIYADIDILIRPEQKELALAVLKKQGYSQVYSSEKHVMAMKFQDINLEIHTSLLPGWINHIPQEILWNRAASIKLNSREIHFLSPEDNLMHLCLQLRHEWPNIYFLRLCDIKETLAAFEGQLDWDYILSASRKYCIKRTTNWALSLAKIFFNCSVPETVLAGVASTRISYQHIANRLCYMQQNQKLNLKNQLIKLDLLDNSADGLKILGHAVFKRISGCEF